MLDKFAEIQTKRKSMRSDKDVFLVQTRLSFNVSSNVLCSPYFARLMPDVMCGMTFFLLLRTQPMWC
jgi:hypothetical protein